LTVFILITLLLVPYTPSIVRGRPQPQGRWSARTGPKVASSAAAAMASARDQRLQRLSRPLRGMLLRETDDGVQ
jgi:hypothetical protein